MLEKLQCVTGALLAKVVLPISIGNYMVQEALINEKSHTCLTKCL